MIFGGCPWETGAGKPELIGLTVDWGEGADRTGHTGEAPGVGEGEDAVGLGWAARDGWMREDGLGWDAVRCRCE